MTNFVSSVPFRKSTCFVRPTCAPVSYPPRPKWVAKQLTKAETAQTVDYLDSGKIKTKGIVNKVFKLEQFGEALESIRNKTAIKAAIVFDD